jgi:hypothetical protein
MSREVILNRLWKAKEQLENAVDKAYSVEDNTYAVLHAVKNTENKHIWNLVCSATDSAENVLIEVEEAFKIICNTIDVLEKENVDE